MQRKPSNSKAWIIFGICLLIVSLNPSIVKGQLTYDVYIDQSDTLTSLEYGLGPVLKILDQDNRYIVFDFWNFRILFFEKGAALEDHVYLNSIGSYLNAQGDSPYHPDYNDRLSVEFTGTIFRDTLWVCNYTYGEILQFSLDGEYIRTLPGQFKLLDVNDSQLYGFVSKKIYRFDDASRSFDFLNDLPMTYGMQTDRHGASVKIGSDRLGVIDYNALNLYNLDDIINNGIEAIQLFTWPGSSMPDFEILPDNVILVTNYTGAFQYSDLDGNNVQTGNFGKHTDRLYYNGSRLHRSGFNTIATYDTYLTPLSSITRDPDYANIVFLGGDMENLYLYDLHDGGFRYAPLDHEAGTYEWNEDYEIGYSAWEKVMRIHDDYIFLMSEWPPGSYFMNRFDIPSETRFSFPIDVSQGFDIIDDNLLVLSGKTLTRTDFDGVVLETQTLSNLEGRNLNTVDESSEIYFTANDNHIYVGFEDTLYSFDHNGMFENANHFRMYSYGELYTYNTYVIGTAPLHYIDTNSGMVNGLFDQSVPSSGYVYDQYYWYSPRWYQFASQNMYKLITEPVWEVQASNVDTRLLGVSAVTDEIGWIVGPEGVVLRTANGGMDWAYVSGNIDTLQFTSVAGLDDMTAVLAGYTLVTRQGLILKTSDGGYSWSSVYEEGSCYINNITLFSSTHGIAIGDPVGGTWRILETTDGGDSWSQKAGAPSEIDDDYGSTCGVYWVDSSNGWFGTRNDRAYHTTDGGNTWAGVPVPSLARVTTLAFNTSGLGLAGSGSDGELARTSDNGANWDSITAPETGTIYHLIYHDGAFWLLLNNKGFRSDDAGDSWEEVTTAAQNLRFLSFTKENEWNYGWAVGNNGTIIRSVNQSGFKGDETNTVILREFALHQNYPNPFNPETTVTYYLPARSHTRLNIYSITGRLVRTLVDRVETSGQKLVMWDGRDDAGMTLPSGVYLCSLVTDKTHLSRKMVLLK